LYFSAIWKENNKKELSMLLTISVTVMAACVFIVMFFLVPVLLQLYRTSCEIKKLTETLNAQIVPLSSQLAEVMCEAKGLIQSIGRQADHVDEGITALRDIAIRLQEFQSAIRDKTLPLIKLASVIGFGGKGLLSFIKFFRR
jgi:uncharacterized protein YoxC